MGDARKPLGTCNVSFLDRETVPIPIDSHKHIGEEVLRVITKLQRLSRVAGSTKNRFMRRFFWFSLRQELEELQRESDLQ
ncbi:MAG: hypothetical protein KDD70_12095 [Bdellovibrionales bacterium]|nr:hypothetical protein [Bdellovibrionales bacterium]